MIDGFELIETIEEARCDHLKDVFSECCDYTLVGICEYIIYIIKEMEERNECS